MNFRPDPLVEGATPWWMDGAERLAEANRIERMAALRQSLESHGIGVRQDIVPGASHDGRAILAPVKAWFSETIAAARSEGKP